MFESRRVAGQRKGERFIDERDSPALVLPDQPGGDGFILLDARIAALFTAWPHFISTAPGVAYAYLADYGATAATSIRKRRRSQHSPKSSACRRDRSSARCARLNEKAGNRPAFGDGPYVALGPARAVFVHNEGGLPVDHEHRVLRRGDKPIPGLYAAGATGQGGLLLKGHGHHLAWAFASGRRAGRNAALAVKA